MAERKEVHLFASQRVNRKARTDNEAVLNEQIRLITNERMESGTLGDFKQLVEDMGSAGIAIGNDNIVLKAAQTKVIGSNNNEIALFDQNGFNADLIHAKELETIGNGARVLIKDGLLEVFGANGVCNIRFGVNNDGMAVLSYYDDNGIKRYDLGPDGLDASKQASSSLTQNTMVDLFAFVGYATSATSVISIFEEKTFVAGGSSFVLYQVLNRYADRLFGNRMYASYEEEIRSNPHQGFKPFQAAPSSTLKTLYTYKAGYIQSTIVKDDKYKLTAALAEEANGKTFTSDVICDGTKLINLAEGIFCDKDSQVNVATFPPPSSGSFTFPAYSLNFTYFKGGKQQRYAESLLSGSNTVDYRFNTINSTILRTVSANMSVHSL